MKKVKITVIRKACYLDLIERYENPIEHACDLIEGQVFIIEKGRCLIGIYLFIILLPLKQTCYLRFVCSRDF